MRDKIKDLTLLFTDAELILQECRELKFNLSLELQALRDDRRSHEREFKESMAHLVETLDQIRAKHIIEAQLLKLIGPQKPRNRDNGKIEVNISKRSQRIS